MPNIYSTLRDEFPHSELSAIHGEPTYVLLKLLRSEVAANAMSIESAFGGGNHGHLTLVLGPPDYFRITGHAFVAPLHPGPAPVYPIGPPNLTTVQRDNITDQYKRDLENYKQYHAVDKALRKLITTAIEPVYYKTLEIPMLGLGNTTTLELLTHLMSNYAHISLQDLNQNMENMKAPWSPDTPMQEMWTRLDEGAQMANDGGHPILANLVLFALTNLTETGHFTEELKQWDARNEVDKTYPNLKTFFDNANRRIKRVTGTTTASRGYANLAEVAANTNEHLTNALANAAQERQARGVAEAENATLKAKVQILETQMQTLNTAIANITSNRNNNRGNTNSNGNNNNTYSNNNRGNNNRGNYVGNNYRDNYNNNSGNNHTNSGNNSGNNHTNSGANNNNTGNNNGNNNNTGNNNGNTNNANVHYCWSHGYKSNHTSSSCPNPANGHKPRATARDNLGGSVANRD